MRLSIWALPLVITFTVPVLAEDLTVVTKYTKGDGASTTGTSYFTSDKVRMSQGNGQEIIADSASDNLTVLDAAKKEYFVITPKDIEAASAQMDARTQNMPPEVREKMAAMMGNMAANVEVQKGTGGRTVAGYACQNWIVTMGKMMKQDVCVTSDIAMPTGAFDAMKRFAAGMGAAGPMGKSMATMWDKFREMKGFHLASKTTVSVMGHDTVSTSEVSDIKKGPVPASVFAIPADYKKVDSPLARMGQGGPGGKGR